MLKRTKILVIIAISTSIIFISSLIFANANARHFFTNIILSLSIVAEGEDLPPPPERDFPSGQTTGMMQKKELETADPQEEIPEEEPPFQQSPHGGSPQSDKSKKQDQKPETLGSSDDDLTSEEEEISDDEESAEKSYENKIHQKIPQEIPPKSIPEKQNFLINLISEIGFTLLMIKRYIWEIISALAKAISTICIYFFTKIM